MALYFVAQQQNSRLLILTLPGLQETVGGGEGGNILLIDYWAHGTRASAGGEGRGNCQQQKNQNSVQ
jgi:hypothetical protein